MKDCARPKRKFNAWKFMRGSISILLSIVLSGILTLGTLLVEMGRYQEAKQQLEESSIVSALSLLAEYDTDLESRFGLYGINSETVSSNVFLNYLTYNSDASDTSTTNLLSRPYSIETADQELLYDLANYSVLERQILEYEKYRGPLNVAEELLDIDKMMKELKENIEKLIPGLEEMLTICDSIADLAEALKALYCLYKDVQQLQMTIGYDDPDLGKTINQVLGSGWETVEGWLGGKEWPSHDPTYAEAYDALEKAVNDKVNYMKNNPKPPDPGPKPNVDVDGLKAKSDAAYNVYQDLELLVMLLERAEELEYCTSTGIANASKKISDFTNLSIGSGDLREVGLSTDSTRQQFFDKMNSELQRLVGGSAAVSSWTSRNLSRAINAAKASRDTAANDYANKYNAYYSAYSQLKEWERKKKALDDYNQKIADYTKEINNKKSELNSVILVIEQELKDYKKSLTNVTSAMSKAKEALKNIQEQKAGEEDKDDAADIFDEIEKLILNVEIAKPDKGLEFLKTQKQALDALQGKNVDASYVFSKYFNKGKMFTDGAYFMTKKQATSFCAELAALNLLQELAEVLNIIKALWGLVKAIQPFPCTYDWDCVVDLKSPTTSILPSRINAGNGTTEAPHSNDVAAIEEMLGEAKSMVGLEYYSDISAVDPSDRIQTGNQTALLTQAITRLSNNLSDLMSHGATAAIMGGAWTFVYIVVNLNSIVGMLRQIINDIIYIAQNIEAAIAIMVNSLGDNLLLNQYAIEKFPNRTTAKPVSGYSGENRNYFPDESKSVQTFSSAHVEYIIGGDYSEQENQRKVFWSLFAIRALNNAVLVAADQDAMSIISACNIAAPLVYILWVYLESNIDMNLLVSRKEVHLIKYNLILSKNTIQTAGSKLERAFKDFDKEAAMEEELSYAAMKVDNITAELLQTKGLFKMDYEDYLWFFMFLVPNQTKVMRMADLVQMEMRYKKNGPSLKFELKNMHTYVRCEAVASFNPILPVIPLGNSQGSLDELEITAIKYVGY